MPRKFSLQPVLDYRHSLVETMEVELAGLQAEKKRAVELLDKLYAFKEQLFQDLQDQQNGEMDLQAIGHSRSNLKTVEDLIRQQTKTIEELEKRVQAKNAEVIEAKQEEETLVTLKNKEEERFKVEQARKESQLQDDIYIAQAHRRGSGL